ncbi:MAG: flap endonuclease-1 [Thermoproteota archaeon]
MGVNLRDLIPKKDVQLEELSGRAIAIDGYNTLYQFLATIRQPDGKLLKDSGGRVTSHLSGLIYRTSNLVEIGVKPIYVFDGVPPALKQAEIQRRMEAKREAEEKYEHALEEGKIREARMYAQATSRLKSYMVDDSKRLLDLMGIPWIQAPSEGEAQAAHLVKQEEAEYCASQDYDSLLFGAPRLVRNITISGRRKLPRKEVYIEVVPEIIELNQVLEKRGVTYEQLIDIAILVGTDFNPEGIKGLGPKTALKLIKKHGSLEEAIPHIENAEFPVEPRKIRDIFLHPNVAENYEVEWKTPKMEETVEFICGERDFSEGRVRKALSKMEKGLAELRGRTSLEKWMG